MNHRDSVLQHLVRFVKLNHYRGTPRHLDSGSILSHGTELFRLTVSARARPRALWDMTNDFDYWHIKAWEYQWVVLQAQYLFNGSYYRKGMDIMEIGKENSTFWGVLQVWSPSSKFSLYPCYYCFCPSKCTKSGCKTLVTPSEGQNLDQEVIWPSPETVM